MERGTSLSRKKRARNLKRKGVIVFIAGMAMCIVSTQVMARDNTVSLNENDCQKCHDNLPKDIEAAEGEHKTAVGCMDCHRGHPPKVQGNIPDCSVCHVGMKHFDLDNCLGCHTNPHTSLNITLGGGITDACLTCHISQQEQLKAHKSMHTTFDCTFCHNEHGLIPECVQCHQPHSDKMGQKDCNRCHQAHKPLDVTYREDTPSIYCAACHSTAYGLLQASPAKHHELNCTTCHQAKHKMIPACQSCHDKPHSDSILNKFETCG